MIELTTIDQWTKRSSAASLANTLHDLGVIDDETFDQLLSDLYNKYGDCYDGVINNNDDL